MRRARYNLDHLQEIALKATGTLSEFGGRQIDLYEWPPTNDKHKAWNLLDWEIDRFVYAHRKKVFSFRCRWGTADASAGWPNGRPRVDFADGIKARGKTGESIGGHEFIVVWPFVRLFSHEYVMQFSAAGELVADYKQPTQRLEAEAGDNAIDLAIYDARRPPHGQGVPVIGGEAKLSKYHKRFVDGVRSCRGVSGNHGNDHRKCLWIQKTPTLKYLWVRSPEKSELFEVIRENDRLFHLSNALPDSQRDAVLSRQTWL